MPTTNSKLQTYQETHHSARNLTPPQRQITKTSTLNHELLQNVYLVHAFTPTILDSQTGPDIMTIDLVDTMLDNLSIKEDGSGIFYLNFRDKKINNLIHCSWGNLVYPHYNGSWEAPLFIMIFPLKYNLGNIYNISPFDTMISTYNGIKLGKVGDFKFIKANTDLAENIFEKLGIAHLDSALHTYDFLFKKDILKNEKFLRSGLATLFEGHDIYEKRDDDPGILEESDPNDIVEFDSYDTVYFTLYGMDPTRYEELNDYFVTTARQEVTKIIDEIERNKNIKIPRNVSCFENKEDMGHENCYTMGKYGPVIQLDLGYSESCKNLYEKRHAASAHGVCVKSHIWSHIDHSSECDSLIRNEKTYYNGCGDDNLMTVEAFNTFISSLDNIN